MDSFKLPERDPSYDGKIGYRNNLLDDCDYMFAKCIFDFSEFKRAAYLTEKLAALESIFLHFYSIYMAIEKERKNTMVEPITVLTQEDEKQFVKLKDRILNLFLRDDRTVNDAYIQYVLAITYIKIGMLTEATEALIKSINLDPLC